MAVASTRGERTRARLLEEAERQLVSTGGQLEIEPLARAAGVSVGGVYHHFGSKEGLLAALVEAFHDRYADQVTFAAIPEASSWEERERERIRRAIRFLYGEPLAPVLLARAATDGVVARMDAERLGRAARASAVNLAQAQREGVLPAELDCEVAASMLMGGVWLVLARAVGSNPRPPADELAETVWIMVSRVVGTSVERSR